MSFAACLDEFSGNFTLSRQVLKGPISQIEKLKVPSFSFGAISLSYWLTSTSSSSSSCDIQLNIGGSNN